MTYGSAGPGTTMNIAGEMLNAAAGIKAAHVPYRGAAPALSDLMGGQIDMLNADFPVLLPLVKAGKVKALAVYGAERSPLLPDVPTTAELGLPDVVMESWYGVFLPAGTPAPMRDKLEKALFAVVAIPSVKERFADQRHARHARQRRFQGASGERISLLEGYDRQARHQGGVTTSSPATIPPPARRHSILAVRATSLAAMRRARSSTSSARARGTKQTPVSSASTRSPGSTMTPQMVTGLLTATVLTRHLPVIGLTLRDQIA